MSATAAAPTFGTEQSLRSVDAPQWNLHQLREQAELMGTLVVVMDEEWFDLSEDARGQARSVAESLDSLFSGLGLGLRLLFGASLVARTRHYHALNEYMYQAHRLRDAITAKVTEERERAKQAWDDAMADPEFARAYDEGTRQYAEGQAISVTPQQLLSRTY